MEKTGNANPGSDEDLRTEVSIMLSDLNEVGMRLDAVVRRLGADGPGVGADDPGEELARMQVLRVRLSSQLDRIREKLLARMPDPS